MKTYRMSTCVSTRRILAALLAILMLCGVAAVAVTAATPRAVVTTTPTGYTKASDVVYKTFTEGKHTGVMNWGARGEDCTFLSPNAEAYYVGNKTYESLSQNAGGTSQSDAASSDLYRALQAMMIAEHDYETNYQETRPLYAYTDCVSNQPDQLVSFYSGKLHTSVWDAGATWNREHTWPNSKGLNGNDENDIMMLRPTLKSENGSRGNKSYGLSTGFFDPGESVRGDCARIVLYIYTRWSNTGNMWGSSGVIENMEVLLRWMAEDPVDTWEMGRNDAVESITGVRNVFIDYPEYAWLLFGQEIPAGIVTPSGKAGTAVPNPGPADTTAAETNPSVDPETTAPAGSEDPGETKPATPGTSGDETLPGGSQIIDGVLVVDPSTAETEIIDGVLVVKPPAGSETIAETEPADEGCGSSLSGGFLLLTLLPMAALTLKRRE